MFLWQRRKSEREPVKCLKTRHALRTDLPDQLQANIDRGASTAQADPHDIICLVKRYMGTESLSQRPLLIMTASRGDRVGLVPSTKLQSCKVSFWISFGFLCPTMGQMYFWVVRLRHLRCATLQQLKACKQLLVGFQGSVLASCQRCAGELRASLCRKCGISTEVGPKPFLCP